MRNLRLICSALLVLSLSSCGIAPIATKNAVDAATAAAEREVDSIRIADYYDKMNLDFATSSQDGFRTALDSTYPRSVDKSVSTSCIRNLIGQEIQWSFKPNLESIRVVENWIAPDVSRDDQGEWLFAGKTPQGRTYELEESGKRSVKGKVTSSPSGTVHLTVYRDKVYMFTSFCARSW